MTYSDYESVDRLMAQVHALHVVGRPDRYHPSLLAVEERTAYLEDLCVSEPFRRRGIGRMLFETASARAKERGAQRMDLKVWEFNEPARKFYASLGMSTQCRILEKEL